MKAIFPARAISVVLWSALWVVAPLSGAPSQTENQLLGWLQTNLSVDEIGSGASKGLVRNVRGFTGEIYTANRDDDLGAAKWVFIPSENQRMLRDAFGVSLLRALSGLSADKRETAMQRLGRYGLIVTPIRFGCSSDARATIEIECEVHDLAKEAHPARTRAEETVPVQGAGGTLARSTLVFMVGTHRDNFMPERAALFLASLRAAHDTISRGLLKEIAKDD